MKFFNRIDSRQFRRSSGFLGQFAARFIRKNNQEYYSRVIDLLKTGLAEKFGHAAAGYCDGKNDFIRHYESIAMNAD